MAIQDYTSAIQINKRHYKSYFNRAYCYDIHNDWLKAIDDYKECLSIKPKNVRAWHHIGSILEKMGSVGLSKSKKSKREPQNASNNEGNHTPSPAEQNPIQNMKSAQKYFLKALKLDPNYAPSYNGLGLVYDACKKRDKALRNFNKALMIDPKNAIYLQNKACCLRKLDMLDESVKYFQKAIKYAPKNKLIRSNLAAVLKKQLKYEEACSVYLEIIDLPE